MEYDNIKHTIGIWTRRRDSKRKMISSLNHNLLVWYEAESRTEYYYMGEDYSFKHRGKLDMPEEIRKYIRNKCYVKGGNNHGE